LHRPGDYRTLARHMARMVQDRSWRITQAQRNFGEAQKYYCDELAVQRDAFWRQFLVYATAKIT